MLGLGPVFVALCVLVGAAPRVPATPAARATTVSTDHAAHAVLARPATPRLRAASLPPFVVPVVALPAARTSVPALAAPARVVRRTETSLPRPRSRAPPLAG